MAPVPIRPARYAPPNAPTVVAISRSMPTRTLVNPSLTYAAAAPEDVAITETSDAPTAYRRSTPKSSVSIGTITIPPPRPVNAPRSPAENEPIATSSVKRRMDIGLLSRAARRLIVPHPNELRPFPLDVLWLLFDRALQPPINAVADPREIGVDDRRHIQRDELRECQPTHYRDT